MCESVGTRAALWRSGDIVPATVSAPPGTCLWPLFLVWNKREQECPRLELAVNGLVRGKHFHYW